MSDLLLHVDNCLGGFYLSFLGSFADVPWNFDLPGVSTISIDVHKYGFASKGASVIAFRTPELRRKAYFPVLDGPTLYITPTLQGARGGAQIASAWATLMAKLKGSIGEGPNHSNFSDQSSVKIAG